MNEEKIKGLILMCIGFIIMCLGSIVLIIKGEVSSIFTILSAWSFCMGLILIAIPKIEV